VCVSGEIGSYLSATVRGACPPDGARAFFRDDALPAVARGDQWIWTLRLRSDPDRIIGAIGLRQSDQKNRGFWIGLPWQGQGLMTEAANGATDFLFEELKVPV